MNHGIGGLDVATLGIDDPMRNFVAEVRADWLNENFGQIPMQTGNLVQHRREVLILKQLIYRPLRHNSFADSSCCTTCTCKEMPQGGFHARHQDVQCADVVAGQVAFESDSFD
jgi:hypothetical protein